MQRLGVSGAVRPIYGSLGVKRLIEPVLPVGVEDLLLLRPLGLNIPTALPFRLLPFYYLMVDKP